MRKYLIKIILKKKNRFLKNFRLIVINFFSNVFIKIENKYFSSSMILLRAASFPTGVKKMQPMYIVPLSTTIFLFPRLLLMVYLCLNHS